MTTNGGNPFSFSRGWRWLKALPENIWSKIVETGNKAKTLAMEDPRRIIHSLKVAFTLTLVSLFYYFKPLFDGFGVSAMWAVLTVVIVFEFSVGATLGKGLNRMCATLIAGALGVKAHWISTHAGEIGEPIIIGSFVFIVATIVTFLRFFPEMKARYDYGLLVFILTFCLISVSGYRDDEVMEMAYRRFTTIIIGSVTSVIVCILICPVWVGEDLHNLVVANLEKLGNFLEGFGDEYFRTIEDGQTNSSADDKSFLQGYKRVLTAKSNEENMAILARWEPGHGRFKFRHPWNQYLKIGTLTRQCAYKVEALNSCLNSDVQTPMEIRNKIQEICSKISLETGKAMKELASSIKRMRSSSLADGHIANSKDAVETLKSLLETDMWEEALLLDIIPAATVASLLIYVVICTQKISESVQELASLAQFKSEVCEENKITPKQYNLFHKGTIQPNSDGPHHIINVDAPSPPSTVEEHHPSALIIGQKMEV